MNTSYLFFCHRSHKPGPSGAPPFLHLPFTFYQSAGTPGIFRGSALRLSARVNSCKTFVGPHRQLVWIYCGKTSNVIYIWISPIDPDLTRSSIHSLLYISIYIFKYNLLVYYFLSEIKFLQDTRKSIKYMTICT